MARIRTRRKRQEDAVAPASIFHRTKQNLLVLLAALGVLLLLLTSGVINTKDVSQMLPVESVRKFASDRLLQFNYTRSTTTDTTTQTETVSSADTNNDAAVKSGPSCLDSVSESTAAWAQNVFQDAENTAMKPWHKGTNWEIPPLDSALLQSAFGGRKVIILGDSTLAYTMTSLDRIMDGTKFTTESLDKFPNYTLSEANQAASSAEGNIGGTYKDYNNSNIIWLGYRGINMNKNCQFQQRQFRIIRNMPPDILLANWGVHILFNGMNTKMCNVDDWVHYEAWLQQVVDLAVNGGTKVLLFKTTNRICRGLSANAKQVCEAHLAGLPAETGPEAKNVTPVEKEWYCKDALVADEASERLNDRLKVFVADKAQQLATNATTNLRIAVYNDHDMMTCQYAADGLHFHGLQLPRIRLFAHMVNCLYPQD